MLLVAIKISRGGEAMTRKRKKFKRKFWVNWSWMLDANVENDRHIEVELYRSRLDCLTIMPEGDEIKQIEVREL